MKRKIITWHGEGKSLFYVVEYDPTDHLNWNIVRTCGTREEAEKWLETA